MPFCRNCGNQLPDNTRFCDKCGAQQQAVSESAPQNAGGAPAYSSSYGSSGGARELLRCGPSNKIITTHVIIIVCLVVGAFVFWNIMGGQLEKLEPYLYRSNVEETYENVKFIRNLSTLTDCLLIVVFIIKIFDVRKNWLIVKEDGVVGDASPKYGCLVIRHLQTSYNRIHSVEPKGRMLAITTIDGEYYFQVEDVDRAHSLIYKAIHEEKR